MRRPGARALLIAGVLAVCAAVGACSSAPESSARLSVTPASGLYDTPFVSTVTGLQPGQRVTLVASSTDRAKAVWRSSAAFVADEHGVVSTDRAPVSGAYTRPDPMGLVETMSAGAPGSFRLGDPMSAQFTIALTVYDGDQAWAPAVPSRRSRSGCFPS